METSTIFEHCYYLVKQTKKPTYLDFYDISPKDLKFPEIYCDQTVRIEGNWYFVTMKKTYYYNEEEWKTAPRVYIKRLYKKPVAVL